MKTSIDTLPLWDAFRQTELCPFCHIEKHLELLFLDTYLGDSVMEPDVRIEVNAKGFCPEHFKLLFQQKTSKLGLALMAHTHLQETIAALDAQMAAVEKCMDENGTLVKRATGSRDINAALASAGALAHSRKESCVICERMETHMERYYETAFSMWEHDRDFAALFEQSNGFCVEHWGKVLSTSQGLLASKKKMDYIKLVNGIQKKALAALEKDLEWFTRKFDYRNVNEPWGNSKDALPRALNTIAGNIVDRDA